MFEVRYFSMRHYCASVVCLSAVRRSHWTVNLYLFSVKICFAPHCTFPLGVTVVRCDNDEAGGTLGYTRSYVRLYHMGQRSIKSFRCRELVRAASSSGHLPVVNSHVMMVPKEDWVRDIRLEWPLRMLQLSLQKVERTWQI